MNREPDPDDVARIAELLRQHPEIVDKVRELLDEELGDTSN